ncbi:c-type cytochrome [Rubinisphaera italica]|uniref:Cytochrome c n=1 Tax=Rubinisphaera italica TaxID=2527969 RepID=A0A5C5XH28_9PLAN|nr:cytochrome c [Rubinisphaera italica]TWT61593.1 Cytochrome c [Rubinisphaera italica]
MQWSLATLILLSCLTSRIDAQEPPAHFSPAERGYWFILNKPYLIPDFDNDTFENLWQSWPEAERNRLEMLPLDLRREEIFSYYGLTNRPSERSEKPLQYVVNNNGQYFMNCFSCHGGEVAGWVIPGLPNSNYALQTLTDDVRTTKLRIGKPLSSRDLSSIFFPMGGTNGTTNAVMFGVALESYRDHDMNILSFRSPPRMIHHDMEPPPWWHFKKRKYLYIDGFVEKDYRALIPFVLIRENDRAQLDEWESDFKDIYAYLESIEAPKYPFEINADLARAGELVFHKNCVECHGTYGDSPTYPQRTIPIEVIGTDPVRLQALSREHRANYGKSWLSHYGARKIIENPEGYVAPPLDGIWASAPYFHNGSVPTLEGVLSLEKRPEVWKKESQKYDTEAVGVTFSAYDRTPVEVTAPAERRRYFDTSKPGKSNSGHDYPNTLSSADKKALLEYLKTL